MSVKIHLLGIAIFILGVLAFQSDACCCGCGCCGCCRCCQYCCPQPPIIIQPPPALHNVCHVPCCCGCCKPCCCGCGCCGCGGRRKRSDPMERRKITKLNRLCKQMDPVDRLALAISPPKDDTKPLRAKRSAKPIKVKKMQTPNTACKC